MNSAAVQKAPKAAKRSSSADQLLEAASKILAQRNSIDVSLSEIAEASGLNSALIKYHFGSKDGLLVALVRRDATLALKKLDDLVAMQLAPETKVRLHIAGVINTYTKYPYLNRLIHVLLTNSNEKLAREIADFFVKPLVDSQKKILEEGVAAGIFRNVDPMFFYYAIVGACDHIFFGRVSREFVFGAPVITSKTRENYIEFVADMALKSLRRE
ncbi:MAG: TetR family transcriptional regulator [Steroidobacteraceae bacterium]